MKSYNLNFSFKKIYFFFPILLLSFIILISCESNDFLTEKKTSTEDFEENQDQNGGIHISIDKSSYNPGEKVQFTLDRISDNNYVRVKHLGQIIKEENLASKNWEWETPSKDFSGYMVEVYSEKDGQEKIIGTVGVDVSSDWSRFPRYGFLSNFNSIPEETQKEIIDNLNKYHLNGLQFYDWHNKPQAPLPLQSGEIQKEWIDIANREISFSTVEKYIDLAKEKNIKTMFYNLAFGVLEDYAEYGIKEEWFLYKDKKHSLKDRHELPDIFVSDILLANPSNRNWIDFINNQNKIVYDHLDFDGYHIDQLGDRGSLYNYYGNKVDLPDSYQTFLFGMKGSNPGKEVVMNAVDQFAQEDIAQEDVAFLYTEVWNAQDYGELAQVILDNDAFSNREKRSVLAAYMNYDLADDIGQFNTPGVLLTDAVIFAFGGAHIELGEHMLGKEYFPNDNLGMTPDLKFRLEKYYDFMVGYENLLRGNGEWEDSEISSGDGKADFVNWPPRAGSVGVVGKNMDDKKLKVIHLINFSEATTMNWRDDSGDQQKPKPIKQLVLNITNTESVKKVWFASPDYNGGASRELDFTQEGNKLQVKLPFLEYWDMLVIEFN